MGDVAIPVWLLLIWLLLPILYLVAILGWAPARAAQRWVMRFSGENGRCELSDLLKPVIMPILDEQSDGILDDVRDMIKALVPQIISGGVGKFAEQVKKDSPLAGAALDLADAPWWQQLGAQIIGQRMGGLGEMLGGGAGSHEAPRESSPGFKPGL